jgi:3-methyladenine DNA glycosylase AlkD
MTTLQSIKEDLNHHANKEKAEFLSGFFKAHPGGYGEGDRFIGVVVPAQRGIAKKIFRELSLGEVEKLLRDEIHEYRLTALFIIVYKYEKSEEPERRSIVDLYLRNISHINNWDLVDASAEKILGPHLINGDRKILYDFAHSDDLWKQRIAIMTTFHFIRNHRYEDTLKIAEILLNHPHDLIHKATGWMLREIGNRDFNVEYAFLKRHYRKMPRTMLRYAIEKFDEELRQRFLKGEV